MHAVPRWSLESELGVLPVAGGPSWGFPDSSVFRVAGCQSHFSCRRSRREGGGLRRGPSPIYFVSQLV